MTDRTLDRKRNNSGDGKQERFTSVHHIGYGGMASVYKVFDTLLGEIVALKVLHPHLNNPVLVSRLKREVLLSRKIAHRYLLRLYDVVKFQDKFGITMEFMGGGTLKEWIDTRDTIDINRSLSVVRDIATGLETAHNRGVLHRDIKPQNVLFSGDRKTVKLGDFGLAFSLMDAGPALTAEGTVGGTPGYMAPEVFEGDFYDPRSDIYSLGILLYEILTGKLPFSGASTLELFNMQRQQEPAPPSRLNTHISADIDTLVLTCISKSTEHRFQTVGEFLWSLEQILSPYPVLPLQNTSSHKNGQLSKLSRKIKKKTLIPTASKPTACPHCNEELPPQLDHCPFCDSRPLQSLGKGDTSIVLLAKQKSNPLRLLIQNSEFLGSLRTYPIEKMDGAIDIVKEATGTLFVEKDEAFSRMTDLPCTLVDWLDQEDADTLCKRLEESGFNVSQKKKRNRLFSFLERKKYTSNVVRGIFSLGGMAAVSGLMVFSMFFMEKMLFGYYSGSIDAMILGAALLGSSLPMLLGPIWIRAKNRPLTSIVPLLDAPNAPTTMTVAKNVLHQAEALLPQLQDKTIRKITVNVMQLLAKVRVQLPKEEKGTCDSWLAASLELAKNAQSARDSRRKLKQNTTDRIHIKGMDTAGSNDPHSIVDEETLSLISELAHQETHAMMRLLQLRVRIERLLASQQLAVAGHSGEKSLLEDAMKELEIQIESVREVDELNG